MVCHDYGRNGSSRRWTSSTSFLLRHEVVGLVVKLQLAINVRVAFSCFKLKDFLLEQRAGKVHLIRPVGKTGDIFLMKDPI